MSESPFERVKALAQQLTPQERFELFDYLSKLPDSLIKPLPPPKPVAPLSDEQQKKIQQFDLRWQVKTEEGRVVYLLNDTEVFTATFNAENYAEAFYEKMKCDEAFLQISSDEQRARIFDGVREKLQQDGLQPTDSELEQMVPQALLLFSQRLLKDSLLHSAQQIRDNLPRVVQAILLKITHVSGFSAADYLHEVLRLKQALTPKEIKEAIYGPEWEFLKPLIGITHGGSEPRFEVTDQQCCDIAKQYPALLSHWQKTARNMKKERHWRAYAKVDETDTPDDLLDRLEGGAPEETTEDYPSIPSNIALEHAARRAGIPPNTYSSSRLKQFRVRGQSKDRT